MCIIREGDVVLIYFDKRRKYIAKAERDQVLHTDMGIIKLGDLIGKRYGDLLLTHLNVEYKVIRPTLTQTVYLGFKRGTQVLYPKDIGYMVITSGVSPGFTVVEGGVGSGVLTAFLANLVKPTGKVYAYEINSKYLNIARKNLEKTGLLKYVEFRERDITKGIIEEDVDAVFLDIPNPWLVVDHARRKLRSGGIFIAFIPTVNQLEKTVDKLRKEKFTEIEAVELIRRRYKVFPGETRPESLMIGHTGFLVTAQKL
ncbi:MAG: hypothetical protein DRJ47_02935 [Thermoprotei archaeon]|nr:MAG: hypothetical protein DRJ47_02935 [Thermoprotei archaeon]